jgi:hypothetical protein
MELPPDLLGFLLSHYVPTSFRAGDRRVLVAGTVLPRATLVGNRATVSLIASAEYAVQVQGGTPRVTIDGQLYQSPVVLSHGAHEIVVEGEFQEIIIIYSRAFYSPLSPRAPSVVDRSDQTRRPGSPDDE